MIEVGVCVGSSAGRFSGQGEVAELAGVEIGDVPVPRDPVWHLEVSTDPPSGDGVRFGGVTLLDHGYVARHERMDIDLTVQFRDGVPHAQVHIGTRGPHTRIPAALYPWLERTNMTWAEAQAYHVVMISEFLSLLAPSLGVVHASAVARDDQAVLLVSAGGVGKTTTACRLVNRRGFVHLADDICIVDSTRTISRSRRLLMVYPYNVSDLPSLATAVQNAAGLRSRLLWKVDEALGLGRRRRRIAAQDIFGASGVADSAEIGAAVLLRRADEPGIRSADITPDLLADAATEIVAVEFASYLRAVRLWVALSSEAEWTVERILQQNSAVVAEALALASCSVVDVGTDADPSDEVARLARG